MAAPHLLKEDKSEQFLLWSEFQLITSTTASSLILSVVYLMTPLVSPRSARAWQYLSSISFLLNGVWAFLVTQHPRYFCLPPTDMVFAIWAMGGRGSKK